MHNSNYFVAVDANDTSRFEEHMSICGVEFSLLPNTGFRNDPMYSINMDSQSITALKLSFPIKGIISLPSY